MDTVSLESVPVNIDDLRADHLTLVRPARHGDGPVPLAARGLIVNATLVPEPPAAGGSSDD
jgi:hypothetical protein